MSQVEGDGERLVDVTGDPRWNTFVQSLKDKDYFQVTILASSHSELEDITLETMCANWFRESWKDRGSSDS